MVEKVKAQTVEQFRLIGFVNENFYEDADIRIDLINRNTIIIFDEKGDRCILEMMEDGQVKEYYSEEYG